MEQTRLASLLMALRVFGKIVVATAELSNTICLKIEAEGEEFKRSFSKAV